MFSSTFNYFSPSTSCTLTGAWKEIPSSVFLPSTRVGYCCKGYRETPYDQRRASLSSKPRSRSCPGVVALLAAPRDGLRERSHLVSSGARGEAPRSLRRRPELLATTPDIPSAATPGGVSSFGQREARWPQRGLEPHRGGAFVISPALRLGRRRYFQ